MFFFTPFLPDPSTFEGAVAVTVIGGLLLALILGLLRLVTHRRRRPASVALPSAEAVARDGDVADLVTGIGQAVMGVRARA
jgi:hypothetical protein